MRIISKTKDYYDCVQAHGQDQGFVYVRTPETSEFAFNEHFPNPNGVWPFPGIHNRYAHNRKFYLQEHIIGFCGKIYPVLHIRKDVTDDPTVCHNLEEVVKFIDGAGFKKKALEEFHGTKKKRNYWQTSWHDTSKGSFKKFFEKCAEKQEQYEKIFRDSNSPIFVATYRDRYVYDKTRKPDWSPSTIAFNAELKKHGFYRIFPTAVAYQEISMYLGGVLGQGNPVIPEISNDDMVESKGFNLKTSFRKEKKKSK
jgi:hypothetical protein